ncbi:MAG: PAS domain-containing protein [Caulobacter sp.]
MRGKNPTNEAAEADETAHWFFETSRDLFFVADAAGRLRKINPAWTSVLGWPAEELLGQTPAALIHPDDFDPIFSAFQDLMRIGENKLVARMRARDGRWRWFEGLNRLSDKGEVVGILRDITEERARDEELAAARRNRELLSEAAGIGTWSYEPHGDKITWSDDILALFGWTPDEIRAPPDFFARLDPVELHLVQEAFNRGVQTGQGGTVEHRMATRDGRWLTMRATFRTEPRGKVFALKGISQDVTELVAARDAAIRGEQRVRVLVEQADVMNRRLQLALRAAEAGAFEIDHDLRSFWVSDAFVRLIGRPLSYEEAANPAWAVAHPDDQPAIVEATRRWAEGDSSITVEFRVQRPDGDERWVRIFYAYDRITRKGVGLVMDIDARKRQELALVEAERLAQEASEAKGRFLANMSHELRTPMNGVLGVLHLLEREAMSEDGRRLLVEALGCGQMLTALLDDVIDFSRIEAGRLELSPEATDLSALTHGVVNMLAPQAALKGVALTAEVDETLGAALVDPVRLRQALFNLVGNAVKFTLEGRVTVRAARAPDGRVAFEVEDTGVGIPLDAQAGLFQRFHQADASTTRRFGGSGLGLAITGRLAEMMGGGVSFASVPGEGSTFRLTVEAPEAAAPQALAAADISLEGLRVLVVEDNATNRMIATRLLEALGASVASAPDGAAGVEAAAHGGFDLILMDIQMPGMDGLEACRRIRALPAPTATTPILALTANAMSHQRAHYLAAGMDGVVSKPIAPSALLAEIARLAAPRDAEALSA